MPTFLSKKSLKIYSKQRLVIEKIQAISKDKLEKKKSPKECDKKGKGNRKDRKTKVKDGTIISVSFIQPGSNNGGGKNSGAPDFDDDEGLR